MLFSDNFGKDVQYFLSTLPFDAWFKSWGFVQYRNFKIFSFFSSSHPFYYSYPLLHLSSFFFLHFHFNIFFVLRSEALRSYTFPASYFVRKYTVHLDNRQLTDIQAAEHTIVVLDWQNISSDTDIDTCVKHCLNCGKCSLSVFRDVSSETNCMFDCCCGEIEYSKDVWRLVWQFEGQLLPKVGPQLIILCCPFILSYFDTVID